MDNGSPGAGRDTWIVQEAGYPVDDITGAGDPDPITNCPDSLPGGGFFSGVVPPKPAVPWYSGPQDFVVTDAHARPTSKDQCKNGGWKTHGVFKNQGDCVTSVATGGKNQPGGP